MKKLIIIAAAGENNALGKDNDLVWHLPDDFKRFKTITSGHKIIMGRKTLESFPKPLPNRTHIAITRDTDYTPKFPCTIVHSLEEAIALVAPDETAFIIGGGEIYNQSMAVATDIELTRVHETFEADAFFPEIDPKNWELVKEEHHLKDERHQYDFTYLTYRRK
ncbi:dihydrofolate reductase [Allomuricauda sp. NBRC 101325]|uniref:dihydrofolate reductase n=1 Tax=Allomuricauda sp. NBRC 101325 TaxID=1113758 RepID=UPI0024A2BDE7|nr:dihydrofolate reductase [Muricauda sp. NBRC 101325]GLU42619.1 dihydrofolate reductase [Muricauda sp. NBRC 101325]